MRKLLKSGSYDLVIHDGARETPETAISHCRLICHSFADFFASRKAEEREGEKDACNLAIFPSSSPMWLFCAGSFTASLSIANFSFQPVQKFDIWHFMYPSMKVCTFFLFLEHNQLQSNSTNRSAKTAAKVLYPTCVEVSSAHHLASYLLKTVLSHRVLAGKIEAEVANFPLHFFLRSLSG